MTAPLTPSEPRDAFALRLYAAYIDIAEERLPEFNRMRFPDRTMDEWRRVADEALGIREPKKLEPRKVRPPSPAPAPAALKEARLPAPQRAVPKPVATEPIWCGQCDRRVAVAQVEACKSQFCKVKAMAA